MVGAVVLQDNLPRGISGAVQENVGGARVAEVVPLHTLRHLPELELASLHLLQVSPSDLVLAVAVDDEPSDTDELVGGRVSGHVAIDLVGELDFGQLTDIDSLVVDAKMIPVGVEPDAQLLLDRGQ